MKYLAILTILSSLLITVVLGGCSNGQQASSSAAQTTTAALTIKWPDRTASANTRLIPSTAQSIKVDVSGVLGYTTTQVIERPVTDENSTVIFTHVPVGPVSVSATAYPLPGGEGIAQATGTRNENGKAGQRLQIVLSLRSTIDHIEVTPDLLPDFAVMESHPLIATPVNAAGETVLVAPNALRWYSNGTNIALIDPITGLLTGVGCGVGSVGVMERDSGKRTELTINVTPEDDFQVMYNCYSNFYNLWGITVSEANDYVYVADTGNHRIERLDYTMHEANAFRWGSFGTANGQFNSPHGIAADSLGNIYVVDTGNCRVQKFSYNGNFIAKWGVYGANDGEFMRPTGIAIDGEDNVYVVDSQLNRVQKFDSDGTYLLQWGMYGMAEGEFNNPNGIAASRDGFVYVADTGNYRIQKFTSEGEFKLTWGKRLLPVSFENNNGEFYEVIGVATDSNGRVYAVDGGDMRNIWGNHCLGRIQEFDPQGMFLAKKGFWGFYVDAINLHAAFWYPKGIAVTFDPGGGRQIVFVADTGNNRVVKLRRGP